jgi:hypothetical protein
MENEMSRTPAASMPAQKQYAITSMDEAGFTKHQMPNATKIRPVTRGIHQYLVSPVVKIRFDIIQYCFVCFQLHLF